MHAKAHTVQAVALCLNVTTAISMAFRQLDNCVTFFD